MRKLELIAVIAIVLLGAFLRLYHLPDTLMFRGDQGRDAIIAKNILKESDIALIGPVTSVGNMYLGPLYYYFMVPFLALTYPDPVGPAYGVALVNILTIYLIYRVGKKTTNTCTGIVAAAIFAVMPMAIIYGRFSWNPNIAPFFSILIFYGLYSWWQKRSVKKFLIIGILTGLLSQTHYVSLTVVATVGIIWLYKLVSDKLPKDSFMELLAAIGGFIATMLPLIAFDFRHNHLITRQFINFFLSPEKHIGTKGISYLFNQFALKAEYVIASLWHQPQDFQWDRGILIGIIILLVGYIAKTRIRRKSVAIIIASWLMMTVVGISFYSHTTFPHYLTYSFSVIALFWGLVVATFSKKEYYYAGLGIALLIFGLTISGLPNVGWSGRGTQILQQTVKATLPSLTAPYNITLLSDDKDYKGMSYRYFFEVSPTKPLQTDMYSNLNTLVIIDETFLDNPLSVPIYEIEAAKGMSLEKKITIPEGPWVYIYKKM